MLFLTVAAAAAMDHSDYQGVLSAHVNAKGDVDYAAVQASGALDAYLTALQTAAEPSEQAGRMAFWINAYNALTIDLIADNFPLSSIRELDGGDPWESRRFTVAGQLVTLNHIEHQILRPMGDPRVHAAINCASLSCPPIPPAPISGDTIDAQLEAASERWLRSNGIAINPQEGSVLISKVFDWYGEDFITAEESKEVAATRFAATYLTEQSAFLTSGAYTTSYMSYDWGINSQ
jgi:hypothetical protein